MAEKTDRKFLDRGYETETSLASEPIELVLGLIRTLSYGIKPDRDLEVKS